MANEGRLRRNQERRTSRAKGIFPPADHQHHDLDDRIIDLENGYTTVTPISANYTVLETDNVIECDGTFTVTLMAVGDLEDGKVYHIKNVGTGIITVDADGTEKIDGDLTQKIYQYDSMMIVSNSKEWWII